MGRLEGELNVNRGLSNGFLLSHKEKKNSMILLPTAKGLISQTDQFSVHFYIFPTVGIVAGGGGGGATEYHFFVC